MRIATVLAVALLGTTSLAGAEHAQAAIQHYQLNIPRQSLDTALKDLAQQTGLQIGRFSGRIDGSAMVGPVKGDQTPEQALKILLYKTGLNYKIVSDTTIAVYNPKDPTPSTTGLTGSGSPLQVPGEEREESGDSLRLSQNESPRTQSSVLSTKLAQANTVPTGPEVRQTQEAPTKIEEIIVTAQKRSENQLDVPISVNAINGERLESLQVNSLADLADYVPGLSVSEGGAPGYRTVVIRGLSSGYENITTGPLVGTYIDDLPVGDSSGVYARGGQYGLDLNPYDIERVEVLKGPQGTLYGANTMGGLVKYALRTPDLHQFEGSVGANSEYIDGSGMPGWSVRGAVNVPIATDQLGVRVSGFYNDNAGYIDNVTLGEKHVNHSTEDGGRATLLWQPTEQLSIHATVLAQDVFADNMNEVTLNGATLQPLDGFLSDNRKFLEPYKQKTRIYSAGLDWDLKFATLTSSTGWSQIYTSETQDFSVPFGAYTPGNPDALVPFYENFQNSKFVEEIRLASPEDRRVQWMLGGYYTKEDFYLNEYLPTFTPSYQPLPADDLLLWLPQKGDYKEKAGFANATYKLTKRFDLGGGVRLSAYSETACTTGAAGVLGAGIVIGCGGLPSTDVTVWMADASFHLNQDEMLYARVATGFRPGSGCPTCGIPKFGVPGIVNPDKTTNYEAGFKGDFLDKRLQLSIAVFHVDWDHIQLNQVSPYGIVYPGNGGTAVSNGFEWTAVYSVMQGLKLNGTLGYTDAHLTQDAPGADGKSGDQLPVSPHWTGSLTADYSRPLDERTTILLGTAYRYRDAIVNQFAHSPNPLPIGAQSLVDIYTGLAIKDITLRLSGVNIANRQSYVGALYLNNPKEPLFVPLQPRTIRLSADYQFK